MDDAALVTRARAGDLGAAGDLLARHQRAAYAVALRLLGEPVEAEDVVQEALVQAYTHLGDLQDGNSFAAWLRRIVVTRSLNVLRRRGRLRFESLEGTRGADADAEAAREWADPNQPTPEEVALHGEQVASVDRLLRRLPAEQRVALLLRDAYDYDIAEVAALQGCGLSAAKMRVSRGRAALRQLLAAPPDAQKEQL